MVKMPFEPTDHMVLFREAIDTGITTGRPAVFEAMQAAAVDTQLLAEWEALDGFRGWLLEGIRITALELKIADRIFFNSLYLTLSSSPAAAMFNVYMALRGWGKDSSPVEQEAAPILTEDAAMSWLAGLGENVLAEALAVAKAKEQIRTTIPETK